MFSKTEVENDLFEVVDILDDILGTSKNHNDFSGQISYDCPVCSYEIKGLEHGDGKGNLEINYKLGVYKCWACCDTHRTYGGLRFFIKRYGTKDQLKRYDLFSPEDAEIYKKKYNPVKLPKEFILLNSVTEGFKLTHHYKRAMGYLRKRNITDDMIVKHHIGFCYTGPYANRIIIPSYDVHLDLNYFIARTYEERNKFKYKNPEAEKDSIIWNERLIDWSEPVYLVEGPFDSIFLPNSIPMLGKTLSDKLFKKLYKNAKKVIIVLDGDAWEDAIKLYRKLNGGRLFGKVWLVELPKDKDIADLQGNLDNYNIKQLS